jgi:fumarate reductase subunit D
MVVVPQQDNSTLAVILEAVLGFFGLFGIGWMVGGYTVPGVLLLVCGILVEIGIWTGSAIAALFTFGLSFFCPVVFNVIVLAISALTLNSRLKQRRAM